MLDKNDNITFYKLIQVIYAIYINIHLGDIKLLIYNKIF